MTFGRKWVLSLHEYQIHKVQFISGLNYITYHLIASLLNNLSDSSDKSDKSHTVITFMHTYCNHLKFSKYDRYVECWTYTETNSIHEFQSLYYENWQAQNGEIYLSKLCREMTKLGIKSRSSATDPWTHSNTFFFFFLAEV